MKTLCLHFCQGNEEVTRLDLSVPAPSLLPSRQVPTGWAFRKAVLSLGRGAALLGSEAARRRSPDTRRPLSAPSSPSDCLRRIDNLTMCRPHPAVDCLFCHLMDRSPDLSGYLPSTTPFPRLGLHPPPLPFCPFASEPHSTVQIVKTKKGRQR